MSLFVFASPGLMMMIAYLWFKNNQPPFSLSSARIPAAVGVVAGAGSIAGAAISGGKVGFQQALMPA